MLAAHNEQPPVFVNGLLSSDTNVRTEYTCPEQGPCEIALYARDLVPAHAGRRTDASTEHESQDEIRIEAAMGFPRLGAGVLTRLDGRACTGFGALQCIYKVPLDAAGGLESGLEQARALNSLPAGANEEHALGRTIVRCFTALDLHAASAAPARKSCHSAPLCIKIRIDPAPVMRGVLDKIFYPSGVTPAAPRARLDVGMDSDQSVEIHVDWTPPVSRSFFARQRSSWARACIFAENMPRSKISADLALPCWLYFACRSENDYRTACSECLGFWARCFQSIQQEDLHSSSRGPDCH